MVRSLSLQNKQAKFSIVAYVRVPFFACNRSSATLSLAFYEFRAAEGLSANQFEGIPSDFKHTHIDDVVFGDQRFEHFSLKNSVLTILCSNSTPPLLIEVLPIQHHTYAPACFQSLQGEYCKHSAKLPCFFHKRQDLHSLPASRSSPNYGDTR